MSFENSEILHNKQSSSCLEDGNFSSTTAQEMILNNQTRKLYNKVKKVSNNDTIKFVDVLNNTLHSLWTCNFSGYFPMRLCGNIKMYLNYSCSIINIIDTNY